jgi:hypothetical protein
LGGNLAGGIHLAVLFPRMAHFWQNFYFSVLSVFSCSNSWVAAGRAKPLRDSRAPGPLVVTGLLRLGVFPAPLRLNGAVEAKTGFQIFSSSFALFASVQIL